MLEAHHEVSGGQGRTIFAFVGMIPALDLINTEPLVRGTREDLLRTPDHLAEWWG